MTTAPTDDTAEQQYQGPYDVENGLCGCHGEPLNRFGRCGSLNSSTATVTDGAQ